MSLRIVSLRTCILLAGVLWTFSLPSFAVADDSWDTKWSSRVLAYGASTSAVGIYRALNPRWDFGLGARVSVDEDNVGWTGSRPRDRDQNSLSISVFPELRKRHQSSQELFTYWGVQGIYERWWIQTTSGGESYRTDLENWSTGLGVAATFGATVRLHRHFGVSADLVPMSVRYTRSNNEETITNKGVPEKSEWKRTSFDFNLALNPSLYVVVFF